MTKLKTISLSKISNDEFEEFFQKGMELLKYMKVARNETLDINNLSLSCAQVFCIVYY